MPKEEKDAKPEDAKNKRKKSSKSKMGGSKSKTTQKKDKKPSKPKKGGRTDSTEEKERKAPKSKEEQPKPKGAEKGSQEPSKPERGTKTEEAEEEGQKSPESEEEGTVLEDRLKTFITAYIDSYMDYVEEQNIKEGDFPLLYAYYPLDVTGYILPDESTCFLFKGLAAATNITIEKADYRSVDSEITDKRYDYISCYPPSFSYTKEEAEKQAKSDVDGDIAHSKQLGTVQAERAAKDETLKSIRLLFVGMPWVAQRKEGEGSLKFPRGKDAEEVSTEALGMKEDEYFSDFSDRVHTLENALLHGTKISTEPPEEEKKEPVEEKPAPPPASETAVPVAAAAAAPGTHVTVEIKQPEAPAKGEVYNERTEEDILRLKKTLYIQSRDIEELRRVNDELSGKLGTLEQMRQTVFRVNRKVFDSDAKMAKLEKSNMDILRRFAELRSEQAEQNKKMRRFIAERAKKARNQALALAGIALGVGMAALILLILEIDLKSLLGI